MLTNKSKHAQMPRDKKRPHLGLLETQMGRKMRYASLSDLISLMLTTIDRTFAIKSITVQKPPIPHIKNIMSLRMHRIVQIKIKFFILLNFELT
ncbi:MAG TPA: hypothetical protein DHU75_01325 [Rikenellaceae bacterium]|nr:hypothetical protein [Rikenellaceae bacterium]